MNLLKLSGSYIKTKPLNTLLNIVLLALGVAIITVLLLASKQVETSLTQNSRGIDLVVGAKGSPLQIILSSIFHIDYPTGNIPLSEARQLSRNRLIKNTIPLSLGDSYRGYRIVGTNYEYLDLYQVEVSEGIRWEKSMEVTLGAVVAQQSGLSVGDTFASSHGFVDDGLNVHDDQQFTVVGILSPSQNVVDNLILTSLESVWQVHDHGPETDTTHAEANHDHDHENEHEHNHDHENGHEHEHNEAITKQGLPDEGDEITSLLVQFRSPMAAVQLPRYINERTNMQAASPPFETARLFSLIGVGIDMLQGFAYVIVIIAALSIFIALYNSLKARRYDLAIMRSLGASPPLLFTHVILEGLIITLTGCILGLLLGHGVIFIATQLYARPGQLGLSAGQFITEELWILIGSLVVGLVASLIPAIQAYRTNISRVLAER
ncbi:ABC transporter permease [Tunicatimonas pelagia]|uniref:ABC transporter permease n=1 Tax=Tunicatimonas pelagia TaxID=931531 RepID=UPI0026666A0C|nr:FtsX-like permease family protein [Tunicatimonas pelagia]WKN42355.1 ABC transporter permease [Tunicatimonas pelagia]